MKQNSKDINQPENIIKEFARLQKFGYKVLSFNDMNQLSFGLKYYISCLIVSKRYLVFVEVKYKRESFSDEQKELLLFLSHLSSLNKSLHYRVIRNFNDCKKLIELLIMKKL